MTRINLSPPQHLSWNRPTLDCLTWSWALFLFCSATLFWGGCHAPEEAEHSAEETSTTQETQLKNKTQSRPRDTDQLGLKKHVLQNHDHSSMKTHGAKGSKNAVFWRSPPPLNLQKTLGEDGDFTFAIVADLNGSYGSMSYGPEVHAAIDRTLELRPDLVICAGDMVAGQQAGLDYAGMWRAFHFAVSDRLFDAGIPFAPSPGNHDASGYPQYAGEREEYARAWERRMPKVDYVDDTYAPFRYAFMKRGVLFIALDVTTARQLDEEQLRWLAQVLRAYPNARAKVVFGHLPLYPVAQGREGDILDDPRMEALFRDEEVDLYVSGHHQAYFPGRRGEVRLLGTGCLGSGIRRLIGVEEESYRTLIMVSVDDDGIREIQALTGEGYAEVIDREMLPSSIGDGDHRIMRDDVGSPNYLLKRLEREAEMLSWRHTPQ